MLHLLRVVQAAAAPRAVWLWAAASTFRVEQVMAAGRVAPVLVLLQRPTPEARLAQEQAASASSVRWPAADARLVRVAPARGPRQLAAALSPQAEVAV